VAVKSGSTVLKAYGYDGMGRRVTETAPATAVKEFYYSDQWQVLEERDGGRATSQYVWSPVYVNAPVLRDKDADGDRLTGSGRGSIGLEQRLYAQQDANSTSPASPTPPAWRRSGTCTILTGRPPSSMEAGRPSPATRGPLGGSTSTRGWHSWGGDAAIDEGRAVSPLHPWARAGKVDRRQIAEQYYVLYSRNSATFRAVDRYFVGNKTPLRDWTERGSMDAIKELVKLGLGVSVTAP
jgi:hypothetical protein